MRNEQLVHVHAELARIGRIEGVLHVDEGRHTTHALLGLGDHRQGQRGFTGRFRAKNFNDAATGKAAHAERGIDGDRAGGNDFNGELRVGVAKAHNRAFAVFLGNGLQGQLQVFIAHHVGLVLGLRFALALG